MKILAIDTSGQEATAAIVSSNNGSYIIIAEIILNARTGQKSWTHSEILMPAVDSLFAKAGIALHDIDYFAYSSGPGSFTGVRIGAATALGLAYGAGKDSIAVPTLDALAYNILASRGTIVPMMDARRGQVYSAIYSSGKKLDTDYMALPVEEVLNYIDISDNPVTFVGDGAHAYSDIIRDILPHANFAPVNCNSLRASSVAACAIELINNDSVIAGKNAELLYVRAPQAVQDLKSKVLTRELK